MFVILILVIYVSWGRRPPKLFDDEDDKNEGVQEYEADQSIHVRKMKMNMIRKKKFNFFLRCFLLFLPHRCKYIFANAGMGRTNLMQILEY